MSAAAADVVSHHAERQLERALIRLCRFSERALEEIWEAQRTDSLSFADAAVQLGHATPADIEAARAGTRKIAVLDKRPLRPSPELLLAHDPFAAHSERIRALRTELMLRHEGRGANLLAIVSPGTGEGRSRLAAELAIAFSQLGQSTLLVDADLRRPRQHQLFGADNQHGLSQVLTAGASPELHAVDNLPNLSVLTAGAMVPNPVEVLSDGRFESLVEHWRRRYDHVVIDTAPVAEYADALVVATLVHRVLVIGRASRTPYKATADMLRRLSATRAQILGAVIQHF